MSDAFPRAELPLRPGDRPLSNGEFWALPSFTVLKRTVNLDQFPGSVLLRSYQAGDVIVREGDLGGSAFFILTREDRVSLGLGPDGSRGERTRVVSVSLRAPSPKRKAGVLPAALEAFRDVLRGRTSRKAAAPGADEAKSLAFLGEGD